MRTGEVEANLVRLNATFALPYLQELIARKVVGNEQQTMDDSDVAFFQTEYTRLRDLLIAEAERSTLPHEASTRKELHELLLHLRGVR